MSLKENFRYILRRLGVGRLLLRIQQLRVLTLRGATERYLARRRYLTCIQQAVPIPAGAGEVEVHMLLHHQRVYEGLWALYSFATLAERPCRMIIHDDGSLAHSDLKLLDRVFPGLRIIRRESADEALITYFRQRKLERCERFRRNLIFALKLFDPVFFAESDWFLLMDSDVLFYQKPVELFQDLNDNSAESIDCLYSLDIASQYCLKEQEMTKVLGKACIERFNPGIVRVRRAAVDFGDIEHWLSRPGFWTKTGSGDYYAELTLWAMALTLAGAQPLPNSYAICAPNPDGFTFGHYCGGGLSASLFYTRGIPYLKKLLLDSRAISYTLECAE